MNHYYSKVVTDCGSESSVTPCSSLTAGWEADKGVDEDHMMPGTMQPRPTSSATTTADVTRVTRPDTWT
ncbi:Glycoside hydrolase family 1 [Phytophthora cactorum]|nr:Glycoside hydrolase family 1 [Phytophthora cactorum]